ncbi:MAG: hypothetical protein ABIP03_13105 [Aquihabitans sp.]
MSCTPTAAPPLARLAELIHRRTDEATDAALVTVTYRATAVEIGFWPIPSGVGNPIEVLVGWLAPDACDVLGLVTLGWAVALPVPMGETEAASADTAGRDRVRITTLLARDGTGASVIASEGAPGAEPRVISEVPAGWGTDALARSMGRPTPPPTASISACVEGAWLAAIERRIWPNGPYPPVSLPGWEEIAMLHPLAPAGMALPGDLLALQVRVLEQESNWSRLRQLFGQSQASARVMQPPGGTTVSLERWFDDGSFSRWTARRQPELTDSLFEVLDILPEEVGRNLMAALTTTVAPHLLPEPFGTQEDDCPCYLCSADRSGWDDEDWADHEKLRDWVNPCGED